MALLTTEFRINKQHPEIIAAWLPFERSSAVCKGGADTRNDSIDFPGATLTRAFGINTNGDVVGTYIASGIQHAFFAAQTDEEINEEDSRQSSPVAALRRQIRKAIWIANNGSNTVTKLPVFP